MFESLQKDKKTGRPKIWLYRDKVTDEPKGDATVTYEDPHAALAAVEWFHNKDFHGSTIEVYIAESKTKDSVSDSVSAANPSMADDFGGYDEMDNGTGRGRGRGDPSGKAWQQDGDWLCPNTRSVAIGERLFLHCKFHTTSPVSFSRIYFLFSCLFFVAAAPM